MNENENKVCPVSCKIEHHAMMFAHGDELTTMTNQAYGEWKPDYAGQMDFGTLRTEPTLQTYIAKCAWCEAWKKHNITEYGKYYCVNVYTVSQALILNLGEKGEEAVKLALADYVDTFGQEYLDVLNGLYPVE